MEVLVNDLVKASGMQLYDFPKCSVHCIPRFKSVSSRGMKMHTEKVSRNLRSYAFFGEAFPMTNVTSPTTNVSVCAAHMKDPSTCQTIYLFYGLCMTLWTGE